VNKNAAAVNNRVSSSYNKKVDYILSSPAAEYGQHQKESANGTNFICKAEQHQWINDSTSLALDDEESHIHITKKNNTYGETNGEGLTK